jgi:hypothetical protein
MTQARPAAPTDALPRQAHCRADPEPRIVAAPARPTEPVGSLAAAGVPLFSAVD